jgi:hypothetical protein
LGGVRIMKTKIIKKDSNVTKFSVEEMVQSNSIDIMMLRKELTEVKENHLAHIEDSINKLDKRIEKIDYRLWSIMILVVGSAVANYVL